MQASSIHGHEAEVSTLVGWRVSVKCVAYHDGQTALFQGSRPSYLSLTRTSVYSSASGDLSDRLGHDLNQVHSICKVRFAALLHASGFDLPEGVHLEDLEEL
ncbi:hypothetical protein EDC04DRAFT_1056067 [Pisolithus marmoratus]|nr:hypothetical protein EDC04DRAFT_1056067 [Pisolithus marmoratus]